jgi:carbonic anhydrase
MDNQLLEGNKKWVENMNREDPDFFKKLGMPQEPLFLYIGCSDARVDPVKLLGLEVGKLFVHRNVGNIVYEHDKNFSTVFDYAVNVLHVPYILVVGHYDCGAVRLSLNEYCTIDWLDSIRYVAKESIEELRSSPDNARRLVELNVRHQCYTIRKMCSKLETSPTVYGFVFDPKDGILKKV